jgi:drug/metabolite transporter (DMT)-like permease
LSERPSHSTLSRTGLVLLALLSVLWGVNWPLIKIAIGDIPELSFRGACTATGAAGLFLIARGAGLPLAMPRRAWLWVAAAALFNIAGWNVLMVYGIGLVTAGRAAILGYTMPLWGVALSALVLGERLNLRHGFGLALGLAGMGVLMGADAAVLDSAPLGALLIVGAAMSWAAGTVILKRAPLTVPVTVSTAWQLVIGGAPIVVAALVLEPGRWGPIGAASALAALYNMTVVFVFCYWAWFRILAEVPVGVAAISTLMIPIIGVFAGALVLGEPVGWQELAALALVVAALAAVLRPGRAAAARDA